MSSWCRSRLAGRPTDAITAALDALDWAGLALPKTRLSGAAIYPVIAWTAAAKKRRMRGPEPTLCRPTLTSWEMEGPESAVRIVGFIHGGAPAEGIDRLKALSAYGPGAIVVANAGRVGRWTMAEADVAGISVVEARADGDIRVVLRGRDAPVLTARRTVATRLREEQLFEWAIHVGAEPTCAARPAGVSVQAARAVS